MHTKLIMFLETILQQLTQKLLFVPVTNKEECVDKSDNDDDDDLVLIWMNQQSRRTVR